MNLLLDTHVLLWFLNDDPQLSPAASGVEESAGLGEEVGEY